MSKARNSSAPVIVFAYNRADKLRKCLQSLEKCEGATDTKLFLFCDGPKDDISSNEGVNEVHKFVDDYVATSIFSDVIVEKKDKNVGLAESVIDGVSRVINEYGKVIVVEDDLIVKPRFLMFMNGALDYYENKQGFGSISAFTYPLKELKKYREDVFVTQKAECWGWATWKDRWDGAVWKDTDFIKYLNDRSLRREFEALEAGLDRLMVLQYLNKISSWAVRWIYYLYSCNRLTVYPRISLVINEGFDGSGTHGPGFTRDINDRNNMENVSTEQYQWKDLPNNEVISRAYARFPRRFYPIYLIERAKYLCMK